MSNVINTSGQFTASQLKYIDDKLLALSQKDIIFYNTTKKQDFPKGHGLTGEFQYYDRLNVSNAIAPLVEGLPPPGQLLVNSSVSVALYQYGDAVSITDVAMMTPKFDPLVIATDRIGLEISELREYLTITNGYQNSPNVFFVNQRGSRANLVSGDAMDLTTLKNVSTWLLSNGALQYDGSHQPDVVKDAKAGGAKAGANPRTLPFYVGIAHPAVISDLTNDSNFVTATTRSNVEKFWNNEIGEYASIRVCRSNMAPWFTGTAAPTGTPGSSGTLATGNYYIVVTGLDVKSGFERLVSQTSAPIGVTGPTGSISVTLPSNVGYVYNVYIGTSPATISNFATSPQGPLQGTYAGQATQLPGGTTVTLSGIGMANMVPPVAPAVGITVFQTFIYGYEAVTTSSLMNLEIIKTQGADKSDPLNQIAAIVGFKFLEGTVVTQPSFLAIAESVGTVVGPG